MVFDSKLKPLTNVSLADTASAAAIHEILKRCIEISADVFQIAVTKLNVGASSNK